METLQDAMDQDTTGWQVVRNEQRVSTSYLGSDPAFDQRVLDLASSLQGLLELTTKNERTHSTFGFLTQGLAQRFIAGLLTLKAGQPHQ
jgi:hypothetical protein